MAYAVPWAATPPKSSTPNPDPAMPDFAETLKLMQDLWPVLTGLVSVFAFLALIWLKRHFVTWKAYDAKKMEVAQRFEDHEQRLSRQGDRIASIEGGMTRMTEALGKLATREDILTLELGLSEVRGSQRELDAKVEGIRSMMASQKDQVAMLTEHLLDK